MDESRNVKVPEIDTHTQIHLYTVSDKYTVCDKKKRRLDIK